MSLFCISLKLDKLEILLRTLLEVLFNLEEGKWQALFGNFLYTKLSIRSLKKKIDCKIQGLFRLFIIQLCFVEYKYRAKRVQISHDICTRLIPPGRVKFKTVASQNFGKRNGWIINLLLDVLVCSIAVYFYSLFVF